MFSQLKLVNETSFGAGFRHWRVFSYIADTDLPVDFQQITVLSDGKITATRHLFTFNMLEPANVRHFWFSFDWNDTSIMKSFSEAAAHIFFLSLIAMVLVCLSSSTHCLRTRVMSSSWVSGPDMSFTSAPSSMSRYNTSHAAMEVWLSGAVNSSDFMCTEIQPVHHLTKPAWAYLSKQKHFCSHWRGCW